MNFLLEILLKVLQGMPSDVVKKSIDKALDPIEEHLQKDGLNGWEKIAFEGVQFIRKGLKITEEPGSEFSDT